MFCKQCGTEIGENDKFCPGCGAIVAAPAPAAAPEPQPAPGNPLLAASRSPLFLVAVICASAVALLQVINLFAAVNAMGAYIDYMKWMGGDQNVSALLNATRALTVIFTLCGLVITVITLIGLWMTYASGVGQGKETLLVRGLKLVKGSVLAEMIYMIVMLALAAFGLLMLALAGGMLDSAYSSYGYDFYYDSDYYAVRAAASMLKTLSVVGLLIIAVAGALMVVFYLKARKAVGYALAEAQTGVADGAPSMYLIVMCFVIGGLWAFFLLLCLTYASMMELTALTVLTYLVAAAESIFFGVVALRYRNQVLAAA